MCESGFRTISMKIKSPQGGFFYVHNRPLNSISICKITILISFPSLRFCLFYPHWSFFVH